VGLLLSAGSELTRFGAFDAGMASAEDPRSTPSSRRASDLRPARPGLRSGKRPRTGWPALSSADSDALRGVLLYRSRLEPRCCFTDALAQRSGYVILCVGDDFPRTDLGVVQPPH
jgi:hypothetical protein